MDTIVRTVVATVLGVLIAAIDVAYMMYLRVPSVLEIRPELADVGIVAGLFGGRPMVYLFHNFTSPTIAINVIIFVLIVNIIFIDA